jgi:ATP-dependent DNA ligase
MQTLFSSFDDEAFEIAPWDKVPESGSWYFPVLCSLDVQGKTYLWQIGFDEGQQQLVIAYGYSSGAKQQATREVEINNSGRNLQQQALVQARSRYNKRKLRGARPIDEETAQYDYVRQMQANTYKPPESGKPSRQIRTFPIGIQPKLDGCRALARQTNDGIALLTRENKRYAFLDTIKHQCEKLLLYLPDGYMLDGEVYNHDMTGEEIASVVRRSKQKSQRDSDMLFYLFDVVDDGTTPYPKRYNLLRRAFRACVQDGFELSSLVVLRCDVAHSHDEIKQYHDSYVENGYEGAILRKFPSEKEGTKPSLYHFGRCSNILKFKQFQDEEVRIVGVLDGKGKDKGLALFSVSDEEGRTMESIRPTGTQEQRAHWFEHPEEVIGRLYRIKFARRSSYGVPLHPVGLDFRDEK